MPVAPTRVTLFTPDGTLATLPSSVLDATDVRLCAEYFAYLGREDLIPSLWCIECRTYGELDTNRDAQDRVIEVLFRCHCRTLYGKIGETTRLQPPTIAPSPTPTLGS